MKKLFLLVLFLSSLSVNAQGDLSTLIEFNDTNSDVGSQASVQLNAFIQSVAHSHGDDSRQLRKIFKGLHKNFLKQYEAYATFDEIFSSGHYDCLTATALFSHVLDQLHYSYDLIETNYHIFLIVKTVRGDVLIETTDRVGGFVARKEAIETRIQLYKENTPTVDHASGYLYQYPFSLYQEISEQNLNGLLYFNQAVKAYNRKDWTASTSMLEKSNQLYASPRCEALGHLLIQTINASTLEEKIKADCMARLKNLLLKKSNHFASN